MGLRVEPANLTHSIQNSNCLDLLAGRCGTGQPFEVRRAIIVMGIDMERTLASIALVRAAIVLAWLTAPALAAGIMRILDLNHERLTVIE